MLESFTLLILYLYSEGDNLVHRIIFLFRFLTLDCLLFYTVFQVIH